MQHTCPVCNATYDDRFVEHHCKFKIPDVSHIPKPAIPIKCDRCGEFHKLGTDHICIGRIKDRTKPFPVDVDSTLDVVPTRPYNICTKCHKFLSISKADFCTCAEVEPLLTTCPLCNKVYPSSSIHQCKPGSVWFR